MYRPQYVLFGIFWWLVLVAQGNLVRNEDICGVHNGRRLYLELGEKGNLYGKNVSFLKSAQQSTSGSSQIYASSNSSHEQCSLELVTCPSCIIVLTFKSLALPYHCSDVGISIDSPCRCDYVWLSEPPYEDVSGTPFCGLYAPIVYRSSTRTLSIVLLYSQLHKHAFTLEYTAERNRLHLNGTEPHGGISPSLNNTGGGILSSPFFPARYPRDLGMEYVITCPIDALSCRIRLLFSDFQLASVSIMEFYDFNGQRIDVSSGAKFRPPVIVSSGPSLMIRFYANGGTGLGYKAFYSFVIGHHYDKPIQPITDCGGYVENLGGAITMMDMVGQGVKTYDCVWLIRPPKNFLHMKTHMYLKVIAFAEMAGTTELTIKQGPTSTLLPLEILRHPATYSQNQRLREHVTPVTSGFHVSLRGTFGSTSHLAIAYAAFSYMDCFTGSDFLCQNHRCIPIQLNCDGFDHCGDNSDEPNTCFQDWDMQPHDRKWYMNKANYYFPKIEHYPDLKTATLVFVASSLGLIVLISALIILLYRMGARARQQRELQSRLQTISDLLDGARIDEMTISDDPPVYEEPPGYDEIVKLNYESEEGRRKKRRSFNFSRRSRSSSGQCSLDSIPPPSLSSVVDNASTSRSSQTTPVPTTSRQNIPQTPPPPYVTPPGSIVRNNSVPNLTSPTESLDTEATETTRFVAENEIREEEQAETLLHEETVESMGTDMEALGAYEDLGKPSIPSSSQSSDPQSVSYQGHSSVTNQDYEPTGNVIGKIMEVQNVGTESPKTPKIVQHSSSEGSSISEYSNNCCKCRNAKFLISDHPSTICSCKFIKFIAPSPPKNGCTCQNQECVFPDHSNSIGNPELSILLRRKSDNSRYEVCSDTKSNFSIRELKGIGRSGAGYDRIKFCCSCEGACGCLSNVSSKPSAQQPQVPARNYKRHRKIRQSQSCGNLQSSVISSTTEQSKPIEMEHKEQIPELSLATEETTSSKPRQITITNQEDTTINTTKSVPAKLDQLQKMTPDNLKPTSYHKRFEHEPRSRRIELVSIQNGQFKIRELTGRNKVILDQGGDQEIKENYSDGVPKRISDESKFGTEDNGQLKDNKGTNIQFSPPLKILKTIMVHRDDE
ncbi:uncharacterized protein Culd isoform X2 [Prorops nasuta]|uniref:uncharacterized protein Culd isoform X2 n=1 Tax=Prorops nasuta TaxID=863751 RepID=UPI0034CE1483